MPRHIRWIKDFASSLSSDFVRSQLTRIVLDATGLKSSSDQLDRNAIDVAQLERRVSELFSKQAARYLSQTQYSLDTTDAFVTAA